MHQVWVPEQHREADDFVGRRGGESEGACAVLLCDVTDMEDAVMSLQEEGECDELAVATPGRDQDLGCLLGDSSDKDGSLGLVSDKDSEVGSPSTSEDEYGELRVDADVALSGDSDIDEFVAMDRQKSSRSKSIFQWLCERRRLSR